MRTSWKNWWGAARRPNWQFPEDPEALHPPYQALAAGYDLVMEHVDYEGWAVYLQNLFTRHGVAVQTVLELGCGTGSFLFALAPLGDYRLIGTDRSPEMIRVAQGKADLLQAPIQFDVADFTNFRLEQPVDAIVLLYDGLNYLLDPKPLRDLFRCVHQALRPGGVFIFDQSTPHNSLNNPNHFDYEDEIEGFAYTRRSHYDAETCQHTTRFQITVGEQTYYEAHHQRAYTRAEIEPLIPVPDFTILAIYDDATLAPAHADSERLHWVLKRPADD